ncbi:MAG TPA: hypothetical protein VJT81_06745 [Burkholderiales bacterium]|nr:hypothetical protein [Burkholderiales bacterium]
MIGLRSRLTLQRQRHLFHPDPFSARECAATAWRWISDRFKPKEEVVLGPESVGLPNLRPPQDPHDVEGRKWFRRALITVCVWGFVMIFMPEDLRQRLNNTSTASPTWGMNKAERRNIKEVCASLELTGVTERCHDHAIKRCHATLAHDTIGGEAC